MKKHFMLASLFFILAGCRGEHTKTLLSPTNDQVVVKSLTYHFDESSGTVAIDSDSGYNGTLHGANRVPGKVGQALQFGSFVGTRVEIPVNSSIIPFDNLISTGAWINLDSLPQSENYHVVGGGYYGIQSFRLQIKLSGQVEFLLFDNPAWTPIVTSNQALTKGTWYYIAVTYDENVGKIYINGVEDNTRSIILDIPTVYNTIYIGAIETASFDYQNQFVGIIDELRISRELWTSQQISDHYNSTK